MLSRFYKLMTLLVVLVLVTGCSSPTPTAAPVVDTAATEAAIRDSVVKTVQSDMTKNAPTATPVTPTNTPEPPTETPLPPTETSVPMTATLAPTATKAIIYPTWTSVPSATPNTYSCSVVESSPSSSTEIKVKSSFDGRWKVKNTGTKTWDAGETDIAYSSGTKFQENGNLYDVTSNVESGKTYDVVIDMIAPDTKGSYSTTWVINSYGVTVCTMTLTIKVVE